MVLNIPHLITFITIIEDVKIVFMKEIKAKITISGMEELIP